MDCMVLVVGASGFIGRHVARRLLDAGHGLVVSGRSPGPLRRLFPDARGHVHDLAETAGPDTWRSALEGVVTVVAAAGIMGERGRDRYDAVHERSMTALFAACAEAGVRRVILVSASGAQPGNSAYWRTKHAAEQALQDLAARGRIAEWAVVRPSVVLGRGGASDRLFRCLAAMPLTLAIRGDRGRLRPIHVADLAAQITALATSDDRVAGVFDAGGPTAMTVADLVGAYRGAFGLKPAPALRLSVDALALLAWPARLLRAPPPMDPEAVRLLARAPEVDPRPLALATRMTPVAPSSRLPDDLAGPDTKGDAALAALGLAGRTALAVMWLCSGLLSVSPFARPDGPALLASIGVTGFPSDLLLYGASALDVALGVALLVNARPVLTGIAQVAATLAFTLILTVTAPEWWLHPFGPLLKNLPVLVLILIVMAREGR